MEHLQLSFCAKEKDVGVQESRSDTLVDLVFIEELEEDEVVE